MSMQTNSTFTAESLTNADLATALVRNLTTPYLMGLAANGDPVARQLIAASLNAGEIRMLLVPGPVASYRNLTIDDIAGALKAGLITQQVHDLALSSEDEVAQLTARNIIAEALASAHQGGES